MRRGASRCAPSTSTPSTRRAAATRFRPAFYEACRSAARGATRRGSGAQRLGWSRRAWAATTGTSTSPPWTSSLRLRPFVRRPSNPLLRYDERQTSLRGSGQGNERISDKAEPSRHTGQPGPARRARNRGGVHPRAQATPRQKQTEGRGPNVDEAATTRPSAAGRPPAAARPRRPRRSLSVRFAVLLAERVGPADGRGLRAESLHV